MSTLCSWQIQQCTTWMNVLNFGLRRIHEIRNLVAYEAGMILRFSLMVLGDA